MKVRSFFKQCRLLSGLLLLCAFPVLGNAQPLEDVSLEYQEQGVVATIQLSGPVRYLSHFPESHGKTLEIYYERVLDATSNETWQNNEVRRSPPSGLIPSFTVTTRNQEVKCDQQTSRDQPSKCDQSTKPSLVIEFSREAEYSVERGKDNRSLLIIIRPQKRPVSSGPLPLLPTIKPEVTAAPAAALTAAEATVAETNKQARALMVQGRDALAAKNNDAAVDALNKLLLLPPNDFTQDGQEWVGVARERAGQIDKAKIEYELYLRLYPEGDGAARVAQRMAGLAGRGAGETIAGAVEEKRQEARWMSFGSVSSRYYYGHSKIDSNYTFNNAPASSSLSLTDQSMLITSVDASERYVSEEVDGRLVFRDVYTKNFLANQPSQNRVNAAYGEIKGRTSNYLMRLGRQSSSGGGVLGRFDGLAGSYGDAQEMRVNAVAGALADYSQGGKPVFVGASVDKGPLSFYAMNQRFDGVMDRRAVGTEFRYFEDKTTAYALLDYDTYFKAMNAAQFMGSVGAFGGTMNFMVDRRKTPSLSIRNALNGASTSSANALLQTMSVSSLRQLALARTATSNMGQVGITVPFREKWQVGGDFRLSNTSGLAPTGIDPATNGGVIAPVGYLVTAGTGTVKSVTGQLIGNGLYKEGDIWSGSVTFNVGSAVSGHSMFFYNHTQFQSGWMMDTSLQLSTFKDQYGGTTKRTSPMVRGTYRLKEQLFLDVDGGFELSNFSGPQQTTKTTRYFYSAGLRWDF